MATDELISDNWLATSSSEGEDEISSSMYFIDSSAAPTYTLGSIELSFN